jgi:hypothetical protein
LNAPSVIVVLLRRPRRRQPDERRDDPFWEFGSFGCTGCHRSNLMNPKRAHELVGTHLAFVQGGRHGFRLVHVTPPIVDIRYLSGKICEAVWSPTDMPLAYKTAPLVVDNKAPSDVPLLAEMVHNVRRPTPISRFASVFRSCRTAVAGEVGAQILSVYQQFRRDGAEEAKDYVQAMPYEPPTIEQDRRARYELIKSRVQRASATRRGICS